jgi:putative transposase
VTTAGSLYKGFRFPPEIISQCVWLYHRFPLSFRDVQELMIERGVDVTHETVRAWCDRFGQEYANQLRRRRPRPGDKWHLDEVFVRINGKQRYLWRAVDQHGNVLDVLVVSRRNAVAAKKFFRKLLKGLRYVPRVIVTDKLASYEVAHREILHSVEHRRSKYLNNRAENSHQPTRAREGAMIAVGTALASGPPHRSQRAGLPHWAPALDSGVESHVGKRVPHAGRWQPLRGETVHLVPVQSSALAAAPQRLEPVPTYLGAKGRHRSSVPGHGVVGEVASHHTAQPLALLRDGLMPTPLELVIDLS